MAIGSITSTGKQNAAVAGGLKYKRIQKENSSFCFLADDTVVDFTTLVNFIVANGGYSSNVPEYKRTAIPAALGYVGGSYVASYTSLVVTQVKTSGSTEWSTPTSITAVGYHSTSGNPFDYATIDNTWTVV